MELTIEHLAAYLPYGLSVCFIDKGVIYRKDKLKSLVINDKNVCANLINNINGIKPILRSLSDLTKEIEHNGEKFVPIERLKEIFNCNIEDFDIDEKLNLNIFNRFEYFNIGFTDILEMIEKLYSWHFDVFGLIEFGLAIDINQLNNNNE